MKISTQLLFRLGLTIFAQIIVIYGSISNADSPSAQITKIDASIVGTRQEVSTKLQQQDPDALFRLEVSFHKLIPAQEVLNILSSYQLKIEYLTYQWEEHRGRYSPKDKETIEEALNRFQKRYKTFLKRRIARLESGKLMNFAIHNEADLAKLNTSRDDQLKSFKEQLLYFSNNGFVLSRFVAKAKSETLIYFLNTSIIDGADFRAVPIVKENNNDVLHQSIQPLSNLPYPDEPYKFSPTNGYIEYSSSLKYFISDFFWKDISGFDSIHTAYEHDITIYSEKDSYVRAQQAYFSNLPGEYPDSTFSDDFASFTIGSERAQEIQPYTWYYTEVPVEVVNENAGPSSGDVQPGLGSYAGKYNDGDPPTELGEELFCAAHLFDVEDCIFADQIHTIPKYFNISGVFSDFPFNHMESATYEWNKDYNSDQFQCSNGKFRGEYFNRATGNSIFVRCDNYPIDFNWGSNGPGNGLANDNFMVRWTGLFSFDQGDYTFIARSDDGIKVSIDGVQIIDGYRDQTETEYRATRTMSSGLHRVNIEYYENGGDAAAKFRWEKAGGSTVTTLSNGQSVNGSVTQQQKSFYKITLPGPLPAGTQLKVDMTGTGDADLYVKYGGLPSLTDWTLQSIGSNSTEQCSITDPLPGDWFILVYGYAAGTSTYTLTARYSGSTDNAGPNLTIASHGNGQTVTTNTITLSGTASDAGRGDNGISSVTVNGVRASGDTATGSGTANWSRTITLSQGNNNIIIAAKDNSPNQNPTTQSITITYQPPQQADSTAPNLTIASHGNGQTVTTNTITLSGTASDAGRGDNGISSVTVNGVRASGDTATGSGTANWSRTITLSQGNNNIIIAAKDNSPNQNPTTQSITITYQPPQQADSTGPNLAIVSHTDGQTVTTNTITLSGTASDAGRGDNGISSVTVNGVRASGDTATSSGNASWFITIPLIAGANTINVIAKDNSANQNATSQSITIFLNSGNNNCSNYSIAGTITNLTQPLWLGINGNKLFVSSQGKVYIVDLSSNTVIATLPFSPYPFSYGAKIAFVGNKAYIPLWNLGSEAQIAVVDTSTNTVIGYIPVSAEPFGIAAHNGRLYVAHNIRWNDGRPSTVDVIDSNTNSVIATINAGINTTDIAIVPSLNRAYAINYTTADATVIDLLTNTVIGSISLPINPRNIVFASGRIYIAGTLFSSQDGRLVVIDPASNGISSQINIGRDPSGLATSGNRIFAANQSDRNLMAIDTGTNAIIKTLPTGPDPTGVAVDHSTGKIYVAIQGGPSISIVTCAPQEDTTGPNLVIVSHTDGQTVTTNTITLSGTASDAGRGDNGISSVTVNGVRASGDTATGSGTANWSRTITLSQGNNNIIIAAKDNSANQNPTTQSITITYPKFSITSPNGGENWLVGGTQIISWNYEGTPGTPVKIDLLKNGSPVSSISASTSIGSNGSGSYSWSIPSSLAPGSDYKIRISSTANTSFTDSSDNNFSLTVLPAISSFSPLSGSVGVFVTIYGTNLSSATDVKFNGASITEAPTVISSSSIKVKVPVGATTGKISATNRAGTATSVGTFKVLPKITGFAPSNGLAGETVTITGTNFTGATAVKFGVAIATFTIDSDNQITATVPTAAITGKISVTTPDGTSISTADFTVIKPPTIGSFSPLGGIVGAFVTIYGTNLSSATDVKFNGASITEAPTVISSSSIKVKVPVGATTGKISATNRAGTATSVGTFKVLPKITGFAPSNGLAGETVTITGTNFTGATAVKFGVAIATFTIDSDNQITATVPTAAITGKISVTTPDGTSISTADFTVIKPPTIGSFSPLGGIVGAFVTIYGTNLSSATDVKFNGASITEAPTVISSSSIKVKVPVGATTGKISATNRAGTATSVGTFKVLPKITGFAPSNGLAGETVTITGTNFTGATAVKFGVAITTFTIDSDNQITATVPTAAITGKISVTTPDGTSISTADFTVIKPPTIGSFSPLGGIVGAFVTIYGTNLSSAIDVKFNGASITEAPTVISSSSIKVKVPVGATTGKISATNRAGTATSVGTFTVTP